MKTLGIVGGIAPPSTIDYYRELTSRYRQRSPDGRYPSILINSIDGIAFLALIAAGEPQPLIEHLSAAVEHLADGGADVALFASNTPHLVFDEVAAQSPIPLISIVEETSKAAVDQRLQKVGLIGARFTMERGFYQAVFKRAGISVVIPDELDREYVHERYFAELVEGSFLPETRKGIAAVVDRMRTGDQIQAVVLAGTELPLLFRGTSAMTVPVLDASAIHVDSAVDALLTT